MAAEVVMLAQRSGFKMGSDLTELEKAKMRHMRQFERIPVADIALRFKVSEQTVYNTTHGFAPAKQKAKEPSEAWKQQIVAAMPELWKMAKKLAKTPDKTDDLLQATILKALEGEHLFEQGTTLMAWLYVMMRNLHLTGFRKWREIEDGDGSWAAKFSVPPEQGHAIDLARLGEALNQLPPAQAESLRLVALQGLKYDEAADELDCSTGTIKSRIHRARESLKQALGLDDSDFLTDGVLAASLTG